MGRKATIDDRGLRKRVKPGYPVTLVLGAGVSRSRGLPLWSELLREAWTTVFKSDPFAAEQELLARARHACEREGLPAEFVGRLDVQRHPLELQFGFEEIVTRLRWSTDQPDIRKQLGLRPLSKKRDTGAASNEQRAAQLFADLLRRILYRGQSRPTRRLPAPSDTLSLVASAVRRSAMAPAQERLVAQVITFNVDDLLEREVNVGHQRRIPYALPISRASALRPPPVRRAIPIYHLHGFIPLQASIYPHVMEDSWIDDAQQPLESLVFTDEQYWRTVGNPTGYASRVFSSALSGCCVFIGLSMTDLNVIRLLAQDAIERSDDFRRLTSGWSDPVEVELNIIEELSRHYWITVGPGRDRADRDRPLGTGMLIGTLQRRGVDCIEIPSWESKEFHAWWKACFLR